MGIRDRLTNIPWIKTIATEEGFPDVDNNRTTKLQINITNPNAAENELLRLVMADSKTVVTGFGRTSYELEDVPKITRINEIGIFAHPHPLAFLGDIVTGE